MILTSSKKMNKLILFICQVTQRFKYNVRKRYSKITRFLYTVHRMNLCFNHSWREKSNIFPKGH